MKVGIIWKIQNCVSEKSTFYPIFELKQGFKLYKKNYQLKKDKNTHNIYNMSEILHIRIKKGYASDVIEDLRKMEAIELLEEPPIPEWQKKEVRRRLREVKKDPSKAISWDNAMQEIKQI